MTYAITTRSGSKFTATILEGGAIMVHGASFYLTQKGVNGKALKTGSPDEARRFLKAMGENAPGVQFIELALTDAGFAEIKKISNYFYSHAPETRAKLEQAAATGQPVLISKELGESAQYSRYADSTLCDVIKWAMPDGTVKTEVKHHY